MFPCPKPEKKIKKPKARLRPIRNGAVARVEQAATKAWGTLVLRNAGFRCEYVDETHCRCQAIATDPHHIIRRVHKRVKWLPDNGMALCRKHHELGTKKLLAAAIRAFGKERINRVIAVLSGDKT